MGPNNQRKVDFWERYKLVVNNNKNVDHLEKKKFFYPCDIDNSSKNPIGFKESSSAENTFKIIKLTKSEIKEIYFLKSFLNYLIGLRRKVNQRESLKRVDYVKMTNKIKLLNNFLFGLDDEEASR